MNLWIAKLGGNNFSESELKKIDNLADDYKTLNKRDFFQFKSEHIHYISFTTDEDIGKKKYNIIDGNLVAFSGLPVCKKSSTIDYRDAANLKKFTSNYDAAKSELGGQYSIIWSTKDEFECFVDFLGIHKVFYSELSNGEILVSNSVPSMQLIKGVDLNFDFYVNWIGFGGIYGYETQDRYIYSIPEYGHLKWSPSRGLKIDTHENLSSLILPEDTLENYINNTVSEFRNTVHNLSNFHKSILPLSGGYDSRLILEAFSLFDTSNLYTYTYPDKEEDVKYAKKIAKYFNIKHEVLKPRNILNVENPYKSIFFPSDPFLDYNKIFGYQFREQKKNYYSDGLNVLLKGDAGDTQAGFRKYSVSNKGQPDKAIDFLVDRSLSTGILRKEVENKYSESMKKYYLEKYIDLIKRRGATHKIANIYYLMERFGNYQSHKLINGYQLNDIYIPYSNENFVRAVFSAPVEKLYKYKKDSLHHIIHRKLVSENTKSIHYTGGMHWEANKFQRVFYRLENMIKKRINFNKPKYSSVIRDQYFEQNKSHYKEIIFSSSSSEIWDYFDYERLKNALYTDNLNSKQKKAVSRIVPFIKFMM
jgi:asparagine synthetase B (glutamine-hydrolysing)